MDKEDMTTNELKSGTPMTDLLNRIAVATVDQQRELLLEAFCAVHGDPVITHATGKIEFHPAWFKFSNILNTEAYENAALTLIPEGWRLSDLADQDPKDGKATAHLVRIGRGYGPLPEDRSWAVGATMAIALLGAILKARGVK